jgi:hypothetical protein
MAVLFIDDVTGDPCAGRLLRRINALPKSPGHGGFVAPDLGWMLRDHSATAPRLVRQSLIASRKA